MTNDKLPEAIQEHINNEAEHHATVEWGDPAKFPAGDVMHVKRGNSVEDYAAGASEWAPWKVRHNELRKVLQEFVSKHEAGLLPDRFVYEKAINVLKDGD